MVCASMKPALLIIAFAVLGACAVEEPIRGTNPDPFLAGAATYPEIEEEVIPYWDPEGGGARTYPPAELRALEGGDPELAGRPSYGSGSASYEPESYEYEHDEDGVWYEGYYYPGGAFVEGEWEDGYFEEDGYCVPGGVLLGVDFVHGAGPRLRPYVGHHGSRDTGYREKKRATRSRRRPAPGARPTAPKNIERSRPAATVPAGRATPSAEPEEPTPPERPSAVRTRTAPAAESTPPKTSAPSRAGSRSVRPPGGSEERERSTGSSSSRTRSRTRPE